VRSTGYAGQCKKHLLRLKAKATDYETSGRRAAERSMVAIIAMPEKAPDTPA